MNDLITIKSIEESDFADYFDGDGVCLFHSTDVEWKRSKGFVAKLRALITTNKPASFREITLCSDSENAPLIVGDFELKGGLSFNYCNFVSTMHIKDCKIENGWLQFDHSVFSKGLLLKDCTLEALSLIQVNVGPLVLSNVKITMGDAIFTNLVCRGNFHVNGCHIAQNMQFDEANFLDDHYDFHDQGDNFIFQNTTCDADIVFDFAEIRGDAVFKNIQSRTIRFHQTQFSRVLPLTFEGIKILEGGRLEFKGSADRKLFEHNTYFRLTPSDISGVIFFEYVNLQFLTNDHKNRLLAMQKDMKVEIGRGCIKYRYQTPEKNFETAAANVQLFEDIARTFTNYFNASTGVSLGLEIVEKTPNRIRFFYFTDENISQDDLKTFFSLASDIMWNTQNPNATSQIEAINPTNQDRIDNLIDLMKVCLKLGSRFDANTFSPQDLVNFANTTSPDDSLAIDPALIKGAAGWVLKVVIENLTINMDNSLLIAGSNSGKVTFKPHFESD